MVRRSFPPGALAPAWTERLSAAAARRGQVSWSGRETKIFRGLGELKTWVTVGGPGRLAERSRGQAGLEAASVLRRAAGPRFRKGIAGADRRAADLLARDGMGLLARVTVEVSATDGS